MLLEGFLALNPPQGFRAELVEGEIVVTPPPDGDHEKYISRIVRQVIKHSRTDMDFSENKGLRLRSGDACPENHVIPDVIFAPLASDLFGGAGPWMPLDGVAMAVEVTAGNLRKDRELKRRCYARGGVALYLLLDRDTAQTTLFGSPGKDDYREHHTRPLGRPVTLPAPFAFELETTDLL
ncbi:Uma2 family endonuclease [Streptomyces nigra]|uniref:Uma2 family endonuclease n=1 Tax=Streptomyces nigra TaxID=1827580 RepID=UPI001FC9C166|nr:Uma2 family endonuclease [Streptomyces nigra]